MDNFGIVEVLNTGLFGFIFLMAYLCYQALRNTQDSKGASVRTARNFLWIIVLLVILAGGFNLAEKWLSKESTSPALQECSDSIKVLADLANLPGATAENLKNQIRAHVALCERSLR